MTRRAEGVSQSISDLPCSSTSPPLNNARAMAAGIAVEPTRRGRRTTRASASVASGESRQERVQTTASSPLRTPAAETTSGAMRTLTMMAWSPSHLTRRSSPWADLSAGMRASSDRKASRDDGDTSRHHSGRRALGHCVVGVDWKEGR